MQYNELIHRRYESEHYKGAAGEEYFEWQNKDADLTAKIELRKFEAFVKPTDSVLDFGCGGGHLLRTIRCSRRIGVEINPAARVIAARGGVECYESINFVADDSVDVVISNHALEHVPFPIAALKELLRKLKRSGVMVLCVPIDDWRTQLHYDRKDINHHLHTWTPQLFGNCLYETGIAPEQFSIHVLTHAWFPGTAKVYGRLPNFVFDSLCWVFSVLAKRRQILALVRKGLGAE